MSERTSVDAAAPWVSLRAHVPGEFTRRAIPVTVGVPFARGACHEATRLGARRRDGSALPLQVRTLDRWGDGSIRWALADLCVEPSGGQPLAEIGPDIPHATTRDAIAFHEGPDGLSIDTGAIRLDVAPGRDEPITLCLAGESRGGSVRLVLEDARGARNSVTVSHAEIEERGPLRLVVKLSGHVLADAVSLDVTVRLHLFAGLGAVRADVTIRNPRRAQHVGGHWDLGDAGSVLISRWSLQLGD